MTWAISEADRSKVENVKSQIHEYSGFWNWPNWSRDIGSHDFLFHDQNWQIRHFTYHIKSQVHFVKMMFDLNAVSLKIKSTLKSGPKKNGEFESLFGKNFKTQKRPLKTENWYVGWVPLRRWRYLTFQPLLVPHLEGALEVLFPEEFA